MTNETFPARSSPASPVGLRSALLPLAVVALLTGLWTLVWASGLFHESAFPSPLTVLRALGEELRSSRLPNDLVVSLFRVSCGFALAVLLGLPAGLWLGHVLNARLALLPIVNFFRNLSPLAWMPFAILWFGVGDAAIEAVLEGVGANGGAAAGGAGAGGALGVAAVGGALTVG
jgi:NitT/TauT family transport system permease protein